MAAAYARGDGVMVIEESLSAGEFVEGTVAEIMPDGFCRVEIRTGQLDDRSVRTILCGPEGLASPREAARAVAFLRDLSTRLRRAGVGT